MRKFLSLVLFYFLSFTLSYAQLDWLFLQGEDDDETSGGIVVDSKDYIYVSGTFEGVVDFDPTNGIQTEESTGAFFLQKLDENQNLVWVKVFDGNGEIHDMIIDGDDNIYITGGYTGSVFSLTSSNSMDGFLVKLDDDGNMIWSRSIEGYGIQQVNGMALDMDNNIYLTGQYRGETDLNPGLGQDLHPANTTFNGFNAFLTKWNNNGEFIWGQSSPSSDRKGTDVIVDHDANVYNIGSKFQYNHYIHFINKLDTSGIQYWNKSGSGNNSLPYTTKANCLAVDQNNNLYIGGEFGGEVDLGYGDTVLQFVGAGSADAFVQCLKPDGTTAWIRTFGSYSKDNVTDIKTSPYGDIYITGSFADSVEFVEGNPSSSAISQSIDIYVMSWNAQNATFNWAQTFGGICDYNQAKAVAFSDQLDVYGTGVSNGSIVDPNGNYSASGNGEDDCLVYKIGGAVSTGEDELHSLSVFPNPTTSTLNIEGIDDFEFELFTCDGSSVLSQTMNGEKVVDLSFLSNGMYFLKITKGDLSVIKLVVKN